MLQSNRYKIIYTKFATAPYRFMSFALDLFIIDLIFSIYIISTDKVLLNSYGLNHISTDNTLSLSYKLLLFIGIYGFACLLFFNRTIGMSLLGISFVTTDANGKLTRLTLAQKFIRGFVFNCLSYMFFFIPTIVIPRDKFFRSIADIAAGTFVVVSENHLWNRIVYYASIILTVFIILLLALTLH